MQKRQRTIKGRIFMPPARLFQSWLIVNGITQLQAAKDIGVCRSVVTHYLAGRSGCSKALAHKIGRYTDGFIPAHIAQAETVWIQIADYTGGPHATAKDG